MSIYQALLETKKITAIVTDLDETLWTGILAEGQTLTLNTEYYDCLAAQEPKGIQLIALSRNDQGDVDQAFDELGINRSLFAAVIANWDPKYLTLERLLQATEIRQKTVVFVDDNAAERSEVHTRLPEVHCLDAADWRILQQIPFLQTKKTQPREQVEPRKARYRTAIATCPRKAQQEDPDYLASLDRRLRMGGLEAHQLDRFADLLVATHRINLNPGRFLECGQTMAHLHERINAGDQLVAISTYQAEESLGLTGALIVQRQDDKATITEGTYSCGIIGRGFEQRSLLHLMEQLRRQGLSTLDVNVTLTSTNQRIREVLGELGFEEQGRQKEIANYTRDLAKPHDGKTYDWITVEDEQPDLNYCGIPSIQRFYEQRVRPVIGQGARVINLGCADSEVIGHLNTDVRAAFYEHFAEQGVTYLKVDIEPRPGEDNIVANAQNLRGVIDTGSQDVVMAFELLEHTEMPWLVVQEMTRICKVGGYIALTAPCGDYPKHEYPIDSWRIGPQTLQGYFPSPHFSFAHLETEGLEDAPYRTLLLVRKEQEYEGLPVVGTAETNWNTGLTMFP